MVGSDADRAFTALADSRRRHLLLHLLEGDPGAEVSVPEDVDFDETVSESLELELHHSHLPRLAELGFITWDRSAATVSRGPEFDEIRPLLEFLDRHRDELPDGWI